MNNKSYQYKTEKNDCIMTQAVADKTWNVYI